MRQVDRFHPQPRRDQVILRATLAQLVEQRFCKAKVPSSSLGGGSSFVEKERKTPVMGEGRLELPSLYRH